MREMADGRRRPSHLTVAGEAGLVHSSSTGDLYSLTQPPSSLHADISASDTDCHTAAAAAAESVLLSQQMKRCTDSVIALRSLFTSRDPQGNRCSLFLLFFSFTGLLQAFESSWIFFRIFKAWKSP